MISLPPDVMTSLCLPIVVLSAFLGLVSGFIPSPLYRRGDTWPRWYVVVQLAMLCLTSLRLHHKESYEEDVHYDEDVDMDLFLDSISLMGNTLYGWRVVLKRSMKLIIVVLLVAVGKHMARNSSMKAPLHVKREMQKAAVSSTSHGGSVVGFVLVMMRNLPLFIAICIMFDYMDLRYGAFGDDCKAERYYSHDYVNGGFYFSPVPLKDILTEFASKWKEFHPPHLWLVRLSHAILYPSILLCLSQSDIYKFLIWAVFFQGIAVNHAVADYIHIADDPGLAELRLEYQDYSPGECYLDSRTSETLLAFPLNFLYLTTTFGDPDE